MPKAKSHKGLLKRIRITANGKVVFRKSNNGHIRSKKTGAKISELRSKGVAKAGDMPRLQKMLQRPLNPKGRDVKAMRRAVKAAKAVHQARKAEKAAAAAKAN